MVNQSISGLILAGGRSRRMGKDKSQIIFHNKPQREYLFDLLTTLCSSVHTSCKATDEVPATLNPLADQYAFESPLNGILSAFKINPATAWLTVPVDMPGVNKATLEYLISHRSTNHIATCFFDSDGKEPEPLLTLWEPAAARLLEQFYEEGKISPRDFLRGAAIHIIKVPDENALQNINSPDELNTFLSGDHSS